MRYCSTRNINNIVSGPEAILKGIAEDGGLYVPMNFEDLSYLLGMDYSYEEILEVILKVYFPELDLKDALKDIYKSFSKKERIGWKKLGNRYILELFHGPTCAFKDFALQVLPLLLQKSKEYLEDDSRTLILTATSGDTGKAALEGFANLGGVDTGIDIAVLYPAEGVSQVQKMQMTTQEGRNVQVFAIDGNFDDAQRAVKDAFLNDELKSELGRYNKKLSSANSINIGRLVPQIVYYFYIYNQLLKAGEITKGEKISFCVPTGNFGDILAGYYAKQMGLPVDLLLSASNENKVLKEFFETGTYDRNRALILTSSPSMDIIVSSNLERLLYHTSNDEFTSLYMKDLNQEGLYSISDQHREIIQRENIQGGYSRASGSYEAIREVFEEYGYLMDPHTAVAFNVADKIEHDSKMVIVSTASPYKFSPSVCDALGLSYDSEEEAMAILSKHTDTEIPKQLEEVFYKEIIHTKQIRPDDFTSELIKDLKRGSFDIIVPATTANVGPGFDSLGIALNLFAKFSVAYEGAGEGKVEDIAYTYEGMDEQYANDENLLTKSYLQASRILGSQIYPAKLKLKIKSDIPMSRGLGSSAAFIVAGVIMAYEISQKAYSLDDILQIASQIEGHPDNVAPAIFGGMRASVQEGGRVYSQKMEIYDDLRFIAAVPSFMLSTQEARSVLPAQVDFPSAVQNVSNTALLIGCFQNRDYGPLKIALRDYLHQPYRLKLIKNASSIFEIAKDSLGVYLSGAGPTIMILEAKNSPKTYIEIKNNNLADLYDLRVCFSGTKVI